MTKAGVQVAPQIRLNKEAVVERERKRKRTAAKKPKPVVTHKTTMSKRRRFQRVQVAGGAIIPEGYLDKWQEEVEVFDPYPVHRWVPVSEVGNYELVLNRWTGKSNQRQVRLTDEHGFPVSRWVETGRYRSEPVVIRFERGEPLPRAIRRAKPRDHRLHADEVVGEYRLLYGKAKDHEQRPQRRMEWFPASDKEKRREFIRALPQASPEVLAALAEPPLPQPQPEQWFRVGLPEVSMRNFHWNSEGLADNEAPPDAREEFPHGWPCKLVQPQPDRVKRPGYNWDVKRGEWKKANFYSVSAQPDREWIYVQFPFHYDVYTWDGEGWTAVRKSDSPDEAWGLVNCGMWVPRELLAPITSVDADRRYAALSVSAKQGIDFEEALQTILKEEE